MVNDDDDDNNNNNYKRDLVHSFNKAVDNSKHSERDKMLLIKLV
jgi:hypothetical protein